MKSVLNALKWAVALATLVAMPALPAFADPPVAQKTIDKPTNIPPVPRAIPQLTPYWDFDPPKHPLFDINRLTVSGDMRVRPEARWQSTFGVSPAATGPLPTGTHANDFYVQQWMRLGINYAISPDVDVFFQPQWAKNWGAAAVAGAGFAGTAAGNVNQTNCAGNICANDPFNVGQGDSLFARQAFIMIRNLGVQNLNLKVGRQLVVMGNHRLFGHFDWANTGFSHDGVTLQYSQPTWEFWSGWLRPAELDFTPFGGPNNVLGNPTATSSFGVVPPGVGPTGFNDADLFFGRFVFKPVAGLSIEPLYVYFKNNFPGINTGPGGANLAGAAAAATSILAPHASGQHRHNVGGRVALRKGIFDGTFEGYWQFGSMQVGASGQNVRINAYALAAEGGVTLANLPWAPRIGAEFNYASGDGDALACQQGNVAACNGTANTFENFYPTNHIVMGYADLMAWRNMVAYSGSLQMKPSADQHIEFRYWNFRKANSGDCWYRAAQNCYFTQANGASYLATEIDGIYTLFFKDNKVAWQTGASYIFAGAFLDRVAGPGNEPTNQIWAYTQLHVNF